MSEQKTPGRVASSHGGSPFLPSKESSGLRLALGEQSTRPPESQRLVCLSVCPAQVGLDGSTLLCSQNSCCGSGPCDCRQGRRREERRQKACARESVPGRGFAWKPPLLSTSPRPESRQIAQAPSAQKLVANMSTVKAPW